MNKNPDARRYQGKTIFRLSDALKHDFKVALVALDLSQQSFLEASISYFVASHSNWSLNPYKKYFERLIESARQIEIESRMK
jgi:chemotaxis methyl-accepting protein methylase